MAAKEVMDPNKVPGSEIAEGGPVLAERGPQVDVEENVGVIVLNGQPTRQVPVYNSKGQQKGWETVLDKSVQFAQPKGHLSKTAHHANLKGTSGKVLVYAETGVLLARFGDEATAKKHLKACGLDLAKLLDTTQKQRGRDIRPAVPVAADKK